MISLYEKLQNTLINDEATAKTLVLIEEFPHINDLSENKEGLLHEIAANNDIYLLKLLISKRKDLDLDVVNRDKSTPLMVSIEDQNFALAKVLIEANCSLGIRNINKETALHLAVVEDSGDLVEELIKRGAEVNAQRNDGRTPLGCLLGSSYTVMDSNKLKVLLDNGADINIPDLCRCTPLHLCIHYQNEEHLLTMLDYKPNLNVEQCSGRSALLCILKKYEDQRVSMRALELDYDLELRDSYQNTLLHHVVSLNSTILAYELIKKGADVNVQNCEGDTPLHLADYDSEMFYMLLYYGANPNVLNEYNESLALAALKTPKNDFSNFIIKSGDYFIGDEQYYILRPILEDPTKWRGSCLLRDALEQFENYINSDNYKSCKKIAFIDIYQWEAEYFDYQIFQCFVDFLSILSEIKSENFSITKYISFSCYYVLLWEACVFSQNEMCERVKIIWRSLSFGIVPKITVIRDVISYYGLNGEFYALMFGGFTKALLLKASNEEKNWRPYHIFLKFLHCDVDSKNGRKLQNQIILHESLRSRSRVLELFPFFNFHYKDLNVLSIPFPSFVVEDTKKMSPKTLQELSRNKVRTCIRKRYRTNNFYEIHEIINNSNIPRQIKDYLQLLMPSNCPVCNIRYCDCYLRI